MSRKTVSVGSELIGGEKIPVQSMLCTDSHDASACLKQIRELAEAGCDLVRMALPDFEAVAPFAKICEQSPLPVVADIHFDYRLALEAAAAGAAKIRINPGNIGGPDRVREVAKACRAAGIPIRVGVNGGSLEKDLLAEKGLCAEALCESALRGVRMLEACDFDDLVVSIKSSSVALTVQANRLLHERCPYPLHIGVTEAGTPSSGIIKSSAGIGALLVDGIGDTIRVSLTADPVEEVYAARKLLRALDLCPEGARLVSCPTCGRTRVDLFSLCEKVERLLESVREPITVAVMGCAVNGPGEAREADVGLAGGDGEYLLFRKGEIVRKVSPEEALNALREEIKKVQEKI